MMNRLNRLEKRIPSATSKNQWQRFAQVVVDDLPAIKSAAGTVNPAEYNRVAGKVVEWLAFWEIEFVSQKAFDDLVKRCTGITADREQWRDCYEYTSNIFVQVAGMIFPPEAWSVFDE